MPEWEGDVRISDRSDLGHVQRTLGEDDTGVVTSATSPPPRDALDKHDRGCEFHSASETDNDEPLRPAKGILVGLLISLAFWLMIGVLLMIWLGHWCASLSPAEP